MALQSASSCATIVFADGLEEDPQHSSEGETSMMTVSLEWKKTQANIDASDPQKITRSCGKLVSAILSDTTKLLNRTPGAGLDVHLASKDLQADESRSA